MENYSIIKSYYDSNEPFPIPFDEFWQWVGYSRKDTAKRVLESNFLQDVDYSTLRKKVERQWVDAISLTIDCAKSFAMLSQTDKGKEVRNYFLQCEKSLQALAKPRTTAELFAMQVQINLEHEHRLLTVEVKQSSLEQKTAEIEAKITSIDTNYYTIAGYFALNHKSVDTATASKVGREASKMSKELGLVIGKIYDARFGEVNSYHKSVLNQILGF